MGEKTETEKVEKNNELEDMKSDRDFWKRVAILFLLCFAALLVIELLSMFGFSVFGFGNSGPRTTKGGGPVPAGGGGEVGEICDATGCHSA
jgi:hypothetical protein